MKAKITPFVTIELADKPYKIRYDMAVMLECEDLGISPETDKPMTYAARLLWVMLKQDEPELTYDEVKARLRGVNPRYIDKKTLEAVEAGISTGDDPNAEKGTAAPIG